MTEIQLKNWVGLFLVLGHFAIIFLLVSLYFGGGFLFEELTTTLSLISPMLASYTTVVIRHILVHKKRFARGRQSVSAPFIFITFMVPSIFFLFMAGLVLLKAYNIGFETFEQFKTLLAAGETIFGVYIGHVVSSLFEDSKQKQPGKDLPAEIIGA